MKEKLFISLLTWAICIVFAFPQARIIMPDSSQISTNPDSLFRPQTEVEQSLQLNHLIHDHGAEADSLTELAQMATWTISQRTGERFVASPDTLLHNYQHSTLPDGQSVAMGFLAPLGSPAFSKIFFDRSELDHFIFNEPYSNYLKTLENQHFINTRVPYSRLDYQRSGNKQMREERFGALLTSNFGESLNVGIDVDLISSKGFYNSQAVKHNNFSLF